MALTAIGAGAAAYGAYNSKKQGDRLSGIARSQNARQAHFAQMLIDLMNNPGSIFDDPGYKESFDQGTQAAERSLAANGLLGSGNAAIELQRFGQSFSSNYLRQQEQLLASLSGAQFNPAQAGTAAQGSYNSMFDQLGSLFSSLGYGIGGEGFGGSGGGTGGGEGGGFGSETSVPGTMNAGDGYIYNVPGA